ncbi:tryptophan-rich sensory protein [Desulfitibacter alkalitolerans]|uniref:tryptophan-rich sensory protein n=1 Tax=Desulfitibacter alkalitolerans TaxID=264641 RepID=UPI000483CD5A|nr:tryptophan-rich sensory protein [Desulfitibacter alkalitolerans]
MKDKKTILQVANIIALIFTVFINYLANALPLNGKTTAEVSGLYPTLFTPAGVTFAIWGLIYLLLAAFVVYQGRDLLTYRKAGMPFLNQIGWWFVAASFFNIVWIIAWHYEAILLSLVIIIALLLTLIIIYLRLGIGKSVKNRMEKYLVHIPFSIYLGWITIATVANIAVYLVKINWVQSVSAEVFWTVIVILFSTALAITVLLTKKDIFYVLVVLWAFVGIIIKRLSVPAEPRWIIVFALVICILAILAVAYSIFKNNKSLSFLN